MVKKFKYYFSKEITKVFSLNAIGTLMKMVSGLISIKIVASLIGPSGVALLGQLNNFCSIFLTLSTGGINVGVTKYIAENDGNQSRINDFLITSLWITLICSSICGLILIIGGGFFAKLILNDTRYTSIIVVFGITLTFYSLNSLILSVVNGFKEFSNYVKINITGSLISMLFSVILTYFLNLYGALLAAVTFQSVVLLVTSAMVARSSWFKRRNFIGFFNKETAKLLSNYSVMALVSAFILPLAQLIIRKWITVSVSLTAAGIWEGMNRISSIYLLIITSSLSVYYLPRLSSAQTQNDIRKEVLSVYKFVVPLMILGGFIIFCLKDYLIVLIFSSEFREMSHLFFFQLIGDFFKINAWVLGYLLIAKTKTKQYLITELLFGISFVGLSILFIQMNGYLGATISYAMSYFGYFCLMFFLFRTTLLTRYIK